MAYSSVGKPNRAEVAYRLAVEFDSHHAMALNNLGVLEKYKGNLEKSIEYYERAVACAPTLAQTLNNLGVIYTMLGRVRLSLKLIP